MEAKFWHERWQSNTIAFHQHQVHPLLIKYFNELAVPEAGRVFVPLCGKTLDISWLLSNGYRVSGAELSALAVEQLFEQLEIEPEITDSGGVTRYSGTNIDIFQGDIFNLTCDLLIPVNCIYDRAALVALPDDMRSKYTQHLIEITDGAPQLVITFEYDQTLMPGPPFSISSEALHTYYADEYNISPLASAEMAGALKGIAPAKEKVWLLK